LKRLIPSRLSVVIGALALGLAAWIVVGGVVLVDSIHIVRTPTVIAATVTDSPQTIIITATPTTDSALLPSPVATQISVVPTQDTPIKPTLVNPTSVPTSGSAQVATTPQAATQASGCAIPAGWVVYTVDSG